MEASPWTRVIGLPGSNQRGPGVPWIRSRCIAPCGPATRAKMASFNRPRMLPTVSSLGDRTQRRIHVGEQQRRAEELLHAGQRPGSALAVTGRGPHPQVSVADVVELGHGEAEVRAAGEATAAPRVAVGIVEPALADRVTASELDDQHRQLATGVGRPGVVEVDDAQGPVGGTPEVVGPEVEVAGLHAFHRVRIDSTSTRRGSSSARRSTYGAAAARDALSTARHSRSPIGAWNHSSTPPSGARRTACRAASSEPTDAGSNQGSGSARSTQV